MNPIKLTARQFAALVKPVIPHAANDLGLPVLSAVLIETDGRWLSATATDRFTLGVQRIEKKATDEDPSEEWPEFRALIPLRSVKAMLTLFKPSRNSATSDMTLVIEADKLIVEGTGGFDMFAASRFTYWLESGEYPDLRKAMRNALAATSDAATAYDFAPAFLARFAVLGNIRLAYGPKGAVVTDNDGFIGAIMPRRTSSEAPEDWTEFLASMSADEKKGAAA